MRTLSEVRPELVPDANEVSPHFTGRDVTVVIPTWNGEAFIGETLDGIAAQAELPGSTIVVDDGSTDGTVEVVRAWATAHPSMHLRLIQQENAGPGAALNAGMRLAGTPLVATLDHDDVWYPEHLALALTAFRSVPGLQLYFSDQVGVSASGDDFESFLLRGKVGGIPHSELGDGLRRLLVRPFAWLIHGSFVCSSTAVFLREHALAMGGFKIDRPLVDDRDFFLRLTQTGEVAYRFQVTARYRVHPESLSAARNNFPLARARFRLLEEVRTGGEWTGLEPAEERALRDALDSHAAFYLGEAAGQGRTDCLSAYREVLRSPAWRRALNPRALLRGARCLILGGSNQ